MKNLTNSTLNILIIILLSSLSCTNVDRPSENLTNKIDSLLKEWNTNYTPGAAISILKDGKLIFKKGYGMSNLEHDIPINSSTIFHIASESKQFTDFCIVLLAQQGKLSLNDDIRKYLPELPDFGKKITIKNLIYHTSGLRDQWQLLSISGTRIDDVIKQNHILKLISKQQRLNFEPGERFIYCNTGYTLLAEIVEEVSGLTLREFAKKEIFEPLGMEDTHFHDNYKEIVKNRAYSYEPKDSITFEKSILSFSTVGATSLFTTVEDESKWLKNYFTGQVGGQDALDQMHELAILNSGEELSYSFGLMTDTYKGWRRIGHGGTDAGYKSYTVRFPEDNLGIVVFSNISNFNPRLMAMKIADIFLEDRSNNDDSIVIDHQFYKDRIGKYFSDEGQFCELVYNTKLYLRYNNGLQEMIPESDSTFSFADGIGKLSFIKNDKNSFVFSYLNTKQILRKYEPIVLAKSEMENYCGTYYSDEVATYYEIIQKGDKLFLKHCKYTDALLTPVTSNQFTCPHWWMSNIIFQRDHNNKILGFEINSGRVLHLYFRKTN